MRPQDFRALLLKPGECLELLGDWAPELDHKGPVSGTLSKYIVVEHNLQFTRGDQLTVWDTAIHLALAQSLKIEDIEQNLNDLLLILRYPDIGWNNLDPNVHVFGITDNSILEESVLAYEIWQPKAIWLESHAIMIVKTPGNLSKIARELQDRNEQTGS